MDANFGTFERETLARIICFGEGDALGKDMLRCGTSSLSSPEGKTSRLRGGDRKGRPLKYGGKID